MPWRGIRKNHRNVCFHEEWVNDSFIGWLTGWFDRWLIDWLVDFLADWLSDRLSNRFIYLFTNWLIHRSIDLLLDRIINWIEQRWANSKAQHSDNDTADLSAEAGKVKKALNVKTQSYLSIWMSIRY